jgi:hypothetical protein
VTPEITINVASVPDRDNVVVELWCGDLQLGELSCEAAGLRIEIYPDPSGKPWRFAFEELEKALEQAKSRLADVTGAVFR